MKSSIWTPPLEPDLGAKLDEWREIPLRHVLSGRQILHKLLDGRLKFTSDNGNCSFEGTGCLEPLLAAVVLSQALVALAGFEPASRS